MKKLIVLMSFSIVLLTACSKEETVDQLVEQTSEMVLVLNNDNNGTAWDEMEVNTSEMNAIEDEDLRMGRGNHIDGKYTGFGGTTTIKFNGTVNGGGIHGGAVVNQVSGPFEAKFRLNTTSVVVNGNEAIYGGIITDVIVDTFPSPPFGCIPNQVGNYVYFKVFDNGQGNQSYLDQYQGLFQTCNIWQDGAASFPWFVFGGPYNVDKKTDRININ